VYEFHSRTEVLLTLEPSNKIKNNSVLLTKYRMELFHS
jgi:hypothetical protein